MNKVKVFRERSHFDLEMTINKFLLQHPTIKIVTSAQSETDESGITFTLIYSE